jgi:hypothetical protein
MRKKQTELVYRRAFQVFYQKAQFVQALSASPDQDPEVFEAALIELEAAHVVYEESRDAWVRMLLESSAHSELSSTEDRLDSDIAESVAVACP